MFEKRANEMKSLLIAFAAAGSMALAAPATAAAGAEGTTLSSERTSGDLYAKAGTTSLAAGEHRWFADADAIGDVEIVVDLSEQLAFVYEGHELVAVTSVSTGKSGHETPTGSFEILQKREEHYSNLYNDAPMPFMQRLTWDGIALHAGRVTGEPASHGCVRLPIDFAEALFGVTDRDTMVHIVA